MDHDDLAHWSKRSAEWIQTYHAGLGDQAVRPRMSPGDLLARLPEAAPEDAESPDAIFADFETLIPGALTHWQHPRFFAYFPANASPASMWAEQLANGIAAQGMLWQTSPAATELEQAMIGWMRAALGLPEAFTGTIHDTATTATLTAVLTMREKALGFKGLTEGLSGHPVLRIYASAQCHSSVDKAVRLAGIGQENLVKVPLRADQSMDPAALAAAIAEDRAAGRIPAGVVFCAGGTSIGAFDDITACLPACEGLPNHLDAAWAGSAMICPEFRSFWKGAERCDSIVFNPHKWLGVQLNCSIQFLRDPTAQINTMGLRPAFLETLENEDVTNFNEWTVPLGRRFQALKLWFVLRAYGLDGLRQRIRNHIAWAEALAARLDQMEGVEITSGPVLALFSFGLEAGDAATQALLTAINAEGRVYLTQTQHEGRFVIRVSVGSWSCTEADVMEVAEAVARLR